MTTQFAFLIGFVLASAIAYLIDIGSAVWASLRVEAAEKAEQDAWLHPSRVKTRPPVPVQPGVTEEIIASGFHSKIQAAVFQAAIEEHAGEEPQLETFDSEALYLVAFDKWIVDKPGVEE